MMGRMKMLAMGLLALPLLGQAARAADGEYDFAKHQPTEAVQSQEKRAGVGQTQQRVEHENRDLSTMNQQLMQRAQKDAQTVPQAVNNPYGVQPGRVVHITPHAGGVGGGAGGSGAP